MIEADRGVALPSSSPSEPTPIRREGYRFITAGVFLTMLLAWIWPPLFWPGLILAAWCAYIFRDPNRVPPADPLAVASPADGRICAVGQAVPPAELQLGSERKTHIGVRIGGLGGSVNRLPVGGRIAVVAHRAAGDPNSGFTRTSADTGRTSMVIDTPHGRVGIVRSVGRFPRRVLTWLGEGETAALGDRLGLAGIGSRVDLYLPPGLDPAVVEGQTVIAGETVVARAKAPSR